MSKAKTSFFIIIALAVALISQAIFAPNRAFAAQQEGSKSMEVKLYYYALYNCTNNKDVFNRDLHPFKHPLKTAEKLLSWGDYDKSSANVINQGYWFNETYRYLEDVTGGLNQVNSIYQLVNVFNNLTKRATGEFSVKGGALIEYGINKESTGSFISGSFLCSSEDEKGAEEKYLPVKALSVFNSYSGKNNSMADMACNISDDGVFKATGCIDLVKNSSADEYLDISGNRTDNLTKFVSNEVFGNSITGGNLNSYTALEKYYLYYNTFVNICAIKSDSGTYSIKRPSAKENRVVEEKYIKKTSQDWNKKVILSLNGATKKNGFFSDTFNSTCNDLYSALSGSSEPEILNAMEEKVQKDIEEGKDLDDPDESYSNKDVNSERARAMEACKEEYTLGWLVCPIMFALSDATDNIEASVDRFFGVDS